MQWVKERLTYAGTHILGINGVQTSSPVRRNFSRNDSSNSNTSGSQYSGTEYFPYGNSKSTSPRTPPPPKTPPPTCKTPNSTPLKANKESGGNYFNFNSPVARPPRLAHLKLTPKSSGTGSLGTPSSVNGGGYTSTNTSTNSSLRRQKFRQQHHNPRTGRRLSKTSSTGTSCGSQEQASAGTSLIANPIVDRLLEYIRANYVNVMDPFEWDIQKKFRLTSFGK